MENKKQNYNIAIVGPEDMVSGFNALGADVFSADNAEDALAHIKTFRKQTLDEESSGKKYGIIMVIDSLIKDLPEDEYARISEGALPTLLSIPGINSDKEAGTQKLRKLAEKAIGSDILS